jgi:peptidoglycan hydrolase-like protein with peptidoglycan-binding domain
VKAQTAPTPDRIRDIQSALAKAGAYDGEPTGKWDAQTTSSLTKFQQSNGLSPTGKLDALTLQKLGLGSDTAGKGAPRPSVTPTSTASTTPGNHR